MGKIADIIMYEGNNSTFIWKHPCEDFNSMTQLIVHESQEAIFFMNGQALDLFGPGRYTLETQNIPILGKTLKQATGGDTPFHCEVYFINKTVQMGIKWGTPDHVRFIEPTLQIPLEIGASGELNLAVSDSRKLLVKLVGTMKGIAWENATAAGFTKSIQDSFRPLIITAVKSHLSSSIKEKNIDLLEIDERLEELSDVLRGKILPGFEEYGLTIPQFYISNILLPENDRNFQRLKAMHTLSFETKLTEAEEQTKRAQKEATHQTAILEEKHKAEASAVKREAVLEQETTATEMARRQAERDLIQAQVEAQKIKLSGLAEAEVMAAKGYSEKDVIQADVQKAYAEGIGNMTIAGGGGGGAAGDMLGLGIGLAAAGVVAPQVGEMFRSMNVAGNTQEPAAPTAPAAPEPVQTCAKCGNQLPKNAKFCLECGEPVLPPTPAGMIVCPGCGKTVATGKFCLECGHPLKSTCPKCGVELVSGAKFCPECGEKL